MPADVLEMLAHDHNSYVRQLVAENPSATARELESLASDSSRNVRCAAAGNPSTPMRSLRVLAHESSVCEFVIGSVSTPISVLQSVVDAMP